MRSIPCISSLVELQPFTLLVAGSNPACEASPLEASWLKTKGRKTQYEQVRTVNESKVVLATAKSRLQQLGRSFPVGSALASCRGWDLLEFICTVYITPALYEDVVSDNCRTESDALV